MEKTLVIYYSRKGENYVNGSITKIDKGNTEYVAEFIKEIANADLFQIETVKKYSDSYMTCIEEAKAEANANERPELKNYLSDISEYKNIVVAGPCWWGTYPYAMFTQLEKLDFTEKKVFPIMTHEGSGLANSASDLKKYCKGAEIGKGLAIHGANAKDSKSVVEKFIKDNFV